MLLVPTNRMVLLAFVLALPWCAAAGWLGGGLPGAFAGLALLALPALVDALRARTQAQGVRVSLAGDRHATQHRRFILTAKVSGGGRGNLALSAPQSWQGAEETVDAGVGPAAREATWQIVPQARGCFTLDRIFHESISPLGLWAWRDSTPVDVEVRVYPDLRADRGALAPMFLRKASIGLHRTRAIGKGREFDQLRDYLPGDGYDDIEWKATARRGRPVTKVHQIERSQDVYIIVDASRRSARRLTATEAAADHAPTQIDRFTRAALALVLAAMQQGDRPGLAIFGGSLRNFLRSASGKPQYNACRDKLFDLQAEPLPPDFADLFAELRNRIRHRALLVFLTDLDDPVLASQFLEDVGVLTRQHLVLVCQMQAPGTTPFLHQAAAPDNDEDVYRLAAGQLLWEGARQTKARLRAAGVHCQSSPADALVADAISAYLDVKRRQLL